MNKALKDEGKPSEIVLYPDTPHGFYADYRPTYRKEQAQDAWRNVVATSARLGIPVPAFSAALAYYDGYRRDRLPANLLQAQRDYFGAHTYERLDKNGTFHTDWLRERRPPNP